MSSPNSSTAGPQGLPGSVGQPSAGNQPWLQHYDPGVPPTIEVPDFPVQGLLSRAAHLQPHKVAVRMVLKYLPFGLRIQARLTYRDLDRLSDRFAAALSALGVGKGSRVAIMLPNLPQHTIAYFGILKAGAIVINTNPTYPPHELEPLLRASGAEAIITLSGLYDRTLQIQPHTAIKQIILTDVPDFVPWLLRGLVAKQVRATGMMKTVTLQPGTHWMRPLLTHAPATPPVVAFDTARDPAVLQLTGGTSGLPKAAVLTHRNLVANALQTASWVPGVEFGVEKLLLSLPAFHVYGMTVGMLTCFAVGGELILVPDPRQTRQIMEVIAREKVTYYPGVPAMYIAIINHPDRAAFQLDSIKFCFCGGAALPVEVAQQFEKLTSGRLVEGYGLSEASPLLTGNPLVGAARYGSVGMPIPSTEVAIVALDPAADGRYPFLGQGQEGELVARGPQIMLGYYQDPEETAKAIDADGWLHTGDIARMDGDGYFSIVDRKKDLIIASGYNVVPREVEEVLFMHPKVAEAAVIGVADRKRGETVKAVIVLKPGQTATPDEIRAFCKARLAPYKVPSLIEFRTALPKTDVGKVLRRKLAE